MWKSRKFIALLVTIVVLLVGASTGAVMAATNNSGDSQTTPQSRQEALLNKVAEIYGENTGVTIDPNQLQNAFNQAQTELRDQAIQDRLQTLVDNGTITQDEADQYLQWLQSKPNIEIPGLMGGYFGGGMMGGHHWGGGMNCAPDNSGDTGA